MPEPDVKKMAISLSFFIKRADTLSRKKIVHIVQLQRIVECKQASHTPLVNISGKGRQYMCLRGHVACGWKILQMHDFPIQTWANT